MPLLGVLYNVVLNTDDKGVSTDGTNHPVFVGKKNIQLVTEETLRGCINLLRLHARYEYWEKELVWANLEI